MKQSYLTLAFFLSLVLGCTVFSSLSIAATDGGQQMKTANKQHMTTPQMSMKEGKKVSKATVMDKVNINTADRTELIRVPGIGSKTAESILKYRNEHGKFTTIDQLTNIKGIGSKSLKKMEKYLSL